MCITSVLFSSSLRDIFSQEIHAKQYIDAVKYKYIKFWKPDLHKNYNKALAHEFFNISYIFVSINGNIHIKIKYKLYKFNIYVQN